LKASFENQEHWQKWTQPLPWYCVIWKWRNTGKNLHNLYISIASCCL